ncbi:NAD(P)H-dependent oxidoreductase [uncultured Brachyspira sp.]|uniref:NAD(P)H-dependent oxidoreductase n=1 Tax=uncultured Brachyspira sp. TaxID=221953 RepID=UPI0025DFEA4C|nr:NAD(P)H-dependent oxidoreductase [uncultured Brachyspira sp.]
MKILVVFSHTYWNDSEVNRKLIESVKDFDNVKIHNLNEIYKDGKITKENIKEEIELLKEADKIIFQFPLFWFSTPSLLKEWEDCVLGYLYHSSEKKCLENKTFQIITTAGGEKSLYDSLEYDMNAFLSPITLSFKDFGLKVEKTYCIYGASLDKLDIGEYQKCFK